MIDETKAKKNGAGFGTHDDVGDEWLLVLASGHTFVGRRCVMGPDGGRWMSPVYGLQVQTGPGPNGQGMMILHTAMPPLLLCSLTKLPIPEGAMVVPIDELSKHEQGVLRAAIKQGEQLVTQMRMSQAGIAVVPQMPNLPPMGGRR